ncbi:MAG: hypothetical protein IPJ71_09670 [Bdellovibrionales bacterium]|nr:hypothetical protein [Bdellovibrionales bacterium]
MKNLRLIVLSSSLFMSFLAHGKANQPQIGELKEANCRNANVYGEGSREPQNEKVVVGKWLNGGQGSDIQVEDRRVPAKYKSKPAQ